MDLQRLLGDLSKWVAPAIVLTALVVGATMGLGPALLVLAGGMLFGVVLLFWSSIGRLTGESPLTLEEAVGLAAPSPEEEKKQSILRALKDLEFERSVGKISEGDFAELSARYRADAKALLKRIDEQSEPLRRRAEELLAARLRAEKMIRPRARSKKTVDAPADAGADAPKEEADVAPAARPCASCGTANDADAAFCKRCGASIATPEGAPS